MTLAARNRLSASLYLLCWIAILLDHFGGSAMAGDIGGLAMLAFLVVEFPRQRRYAKILFLALTGLGLLGIAVSAHPLSLFLTAWRRGAAYGAFFLALASLRDAAETSRMVRRAGQHLVAQPPGRRYAALTVGGHLFGIILSYGSIELLGAMVSRANTLEAAGGSEEVRALRSRRMLMAIFRGFAVMNCWSPLNLMTAVVSTAVPDAPMRRLLPFALAVSLGMTALGWLEDRLSGARQATRGGRRPDTRESWSIHLGIIALIGLVMLLAEAGSTLLHVSLVGAVTLMVPVVGAGWVVAQTWRYVRGANAVARTSAILRRRAGRFTLRLPNFRSEATVLACSGFMGVAVGGALPAGGLAPLLIHLPPIAVPLLVPVLLIATAQLGLNPVSVVALLGAAMPDPMAFGIKPAVLAFACMLGWGVSINMTPMSASAITTARWAEVSPWTVSTVWNAVFTLSSLLLSWAAIGGMFMLS